VFWIFVGDERGTWDGWKEYDEWVSMRCGTCIGWWIDGKGAGSPVDFGSGALRVFVFHSLGSVAAIVRTLEEFWLGTEAMLFQGPLGRVMIPIHMYIVSWWGWG
jgi:hypothetical protein